MTGLFIPEGPVVQVRNHDSSVDRMDDEAGELFYDGPLAVLVNKLSASASEIFSGAIQDYKRGVVIGESTFGKGTVQNIIPLERYVRNMDDQRVGQIKMTLAKFYRVSGSSNQLVGISPDIQFPSVYNSKDWGEASRINALPWDEIESANYQPTNNISPELIDHLNKIFAEDLKKDPDLKKLVEDISKARKQQEDKSISLNLEERRSAQAKDEEIDELEVTLDNSEIESAEIDERLKKDPYLKESLRLLAAMKKFNIG
jgi:carboxyl-terminal processing protease